MNNESFWSSFDQHDRTWRLERAGCSDALGKLLDRGKPTAWTTRGGLEPDPRCTMQGLAALTGSASPGRRSICAKLLVA